MAHSRKPFTPIPPGWFECPCIGQVCDDFPLIPMKVPLGPNHKFPDMYQRWTPPTPGVPEWNPEAALTAAYNMLGDKGVVGMVLDLTNSDKYYDPAEFYGRNVRYVKVPCKGRGESPDPVAVNMAVWEIRKSLAAQPNLYILVHCTHGFNRSGFVIISAAMRLLADRGYCVERLLRRFSAQRPPGIYKDEYIADLFKRHNEHRPKPPAALTPPVPAWKPEDDPDEDGQQGPYNNLPPPPKSQQLVAPRMTHNDKVGDPVCIEEARWVLNVLYDALAGQDAWLRGAPINGFPHYAVQNKPPGQAVIGSQPVSLDRENLELLRRKRYWITWKADGTRYIMLLLKYGAYLIDRAGEVRRVQMRFPSRIPSSERKPERYPLGPPHDFTILDGEMVVDDEDLEGRHQRRRFLIYDIMMLSGEGVCDLRFADRYGLIHKEVVAPRAEEMALMGKNPNPQFRYDWKWEAFGVRRKEFWPLDKARSVLDKMIPQLCHESDGLILQPYDDPYITRTFPHLLKWKFPHMNSVDFKLEAKPSHAPVLLLNNGFRRKYGSSEVNHMSLGGCGFGEQRVEFPADVDALMYDGKIIECSFDMERKVWVFMRERTDKDTANHKSVFEKVMTSIKDNITGEQLLGVFDEAMELDIYREDQMWRDGTHPSLVAQQQRQQQQQPQTLPQHQQLQLAQEGEGGGDQAGQEPMQEELDGMQDADYDHEADDQMGDGQVYSEAAGEDQQQQQQQEDEGDDAEAYNPTET